MKTKTILILISFALIFSFNLKSNTHQREIIIEDFDDGEVNLISYPNEDIEPDSFALVSNITYQFSAFSLKLFGNTWKVEMIAPITVNSGDVWQVAAYVENLGEIQGFGVMTNDDVLFYSFHGSQMLNIEEWITVYQGNFEEDQWNTFQLPIADDWYAWYDCYPVITGLIFVNDNDAGSGIVYFDSIIDITEDLPIPPEVEITYDIGRIYKNSHNLRSVDVQFYGNVIDPDSDEHFFYWNFGDDSTSTLQNPYHTFIVEDDHAYTVLLEVEDDTELWGQATCQIEVDPGPSTFPITMNFAGDIMLARGYENYIIPNLGVEAIFEPTLPILGEAADITVANLECPLTTHGEHHPTKSIYFKGDPENVTGLTFAGIDIVTIANNHILDYMLPGLQETQSVLEEAGVLHSGAGANSYEAYLPLFYSKSGVNIAFLASCDRTGQYNNCQPYLNAGYNKPGYAYMTPYYVLQQIEAVQDYADLIVIEAHCGSEYSTAPGANYDFIDVFAGWDEKDFCEDEDYTPRIDIPHMWDIEIRHHFIDSGADLVICHHPHVIQGFEVYNDKLIAHSLGNFAFDLNYAETFPSMILNTKINETGFYEYSVTPVYIDDYIPKPALGELGLHILDYLARRSKELNTYLFVNQENLTARIILDTLSMQTYTNSFQVESQLDEISGYWTSPSLELERWGNISSINSILPTNNWEYRLGRELLWFGNFEDEGSTGWNVNSNDEWLDDTVSYEGEYSLRHRRFPDSGDNIVTSLEKRIKCNSDTLNFSLQGFIKTQNGADVTIEIRYYENRSTPNYLDQENIGVQITGDTPWTYYQKALTIPEDTRFFDIRCSSDCPISGEAFSWFDNVGIIEWTDWKAVNFFEIISNPNDFYYLQFRSQNQEENLVAEYTEINYGNPFVSSQEDLVIYPPKAKLYHNYPNPFNPETTIRFTAEDAENAEIIIYNIKGQKVKTFPNLQINKSSNQQIIWNGTDDNDQNVSSGIYFYKLKVDDKTIATKKCLLLK